MRARHDLAALPRALISRRLHGNPNLACPVIDGPYLPLSKLDFTCNNSPYINLDSAVQRQRLLDAGVAAAALAAGYVVPSASGVANTGTSLSGWAAAKGIAANTAAATLKVGGDSLPAFLSLHATLPSPQTVQWVPTGQGATFAVVAKLPATTAANSNQVLFDFSPLFTLAREGTGGDMVLTVAGSKAVVKGAFDGKFHSYVAVASPTRTTLYIDGTSRGSLTHSSVAGKDAAAHFFGASAKAQGAILSAEVRQLMAWRRALGSGELGSLNNQMKNKWKL